MKHGEGHLTFQKLPGSEVAQSYNGSWHEDKRHGYGHEVHFSGDEYHGEFREDFKHGKGRI